MTCDAIDNRVDEVAGGESAWTDAEAAHIATCARCQASCALASRLEHLLPVLGPEPPDGFSTRVMTRIRRERWRAEQALDAGFNVALAAGLAAIVAGVAGLAWSSGLVVVGADVVGLMRQALAATTAELSPQLPLYGAAALLVAGGLGAWWWAESGGPSRPLARR